MADLTWSDVTGIVAPELTAVALDAQTTILAYVNAIVDCDVIDASGDDGPTALLARAYLAAHIATRIGVGASGTGAVTSESIGGLSRSYAVAAAASDDELKTTGYGVAYSGMIARSPARGPWVI